MQFADFFRFIRRLVKADRSPKVPLAGISLQAGTCGDTKRSIFSKQRK